MPERLEDLMTSIQETFQVQFEALEVDEAKLEVLSIVNMREHLDSLLSRHAIKNPLRDLPLWAKVWPGSLILGRLLRKYEPEGKTMLELGAGQGTLSLIASQYGFQKITVSDVNDTALLFAKANILHNHLEDRLNVQKIDLNTAHNTSDHLPLYDIIAASELLYLQELHRPLLTFLLHHLKDDGYALFCTDYKRSQKHFAKRAAKQFSCTEGHIGVKTRNEAGEEERTLFTVYVLQKKGV
ncbi:MAG: methyltransferase domain-containing protein [Desulfovibrio sp.]|nr:methyltransferase domain-containing protein [Desulfovibrio sp.]